MIFQVWLSKMEGNEATTNNNENIINSSDSEIQVVETELKNAKSPNGVEDKTHNGSQDYTKISNFGHSFGRHSTLNEIETNPDLDATKTQILKMLRVLMTKQKIMQQKKWRTN